MIIRHGFSTWNQLNLFTGWENVPLAAIGIEEAKRCAQVISEIKFQPDVVYTSVLDRTIDTSNIILNELGLKDIETHKTWRLNERHYGELTGLDKKETIEKFGEAQVLKWRRSFDIRPPEVSENSKYNFRNDPLYSDIPTKLIPMTECLKDVCERVMPFYESVVAPRLLDGDNVMLVAHGNSLRALIKTLENIPDKDIANFELPTGTPRLYKFNNDLTIESASYIEDEEVVSIRSKQVKAQTSKK